jgi:hypothetical protein
MIILAKLGLQPTDECSCQGEDENRVKKEKRRVRKPPETGTETKIWWFFLLEKHLKRADLKDRQSKARPNA